MIAISIQFKNGYGCMHLSLLFAGGSFDDAQLFAQAHMNEYHPNMPYTLHMHNGKDYMYQQVSIMPSYYADMFTS